MDADLEQLLMLKGITAMTGILHEAQILQLKYYPLIATHAVRSSFIHDFENKTIIFNLEKTEGRMPKDLTKRLKVLATSVWDLIGDDYEIIVNLKGREVFKEMGEKHGRRKEST